MMLFNLTKSFWKNTAHCVLYCQFLNILYTQTSLRSGSTPVFRWSVIVVLRELLLPFILKG
jgi:hypothetical protein